MCHCRNLSKSSFATRLTRDVANLWRKDTEESMTAHVDRKWRNYLGLFFPVLVALALISMACSQASTPSPTAAPAAPAAAPTKAAAAAAPAKKTKGYTIGWADIYLTPTWMQETLQMIQAEADKFSKDGTISKFQVFNANGDTTQQIAQIQAMIDQGYDAIIVDAGSSTALNPVLEQAVSKGIVVTNFDSLVNTNKVIRIDTDQRQWGVVTAQWLMDKIGGKGKIIAINGPAGVSVSEDRWAGADSVIKKYPNVEVVANLHSEYNLAPAQQACSSAIAAHPDIVGVYSQGGALSDGCLKALIQSGSKLVPIPGENFNGFLKDWSDNRKNGFSSIAPAQPNYLAVIALDAAVYKLQGKQVAQYVNVPLPLITDDNLSQYVPNDFANDWYPVKPLSQDVIDKLISTGGEPVKQQ